MIRINKEKNNFDNKEEEYKNKYESMSPKDDIDIKQHGELIHALNNYKLLNIGVTGPYSSGKSSVIKSIFKEKNLEKDTIFVSFADFKGKKIKTKSALGYETSVNILELEKTIIDEICNYNVLDKYNCKKLWKNFFSVLGVSLLIVIILILGSVIKMNISVKSIFLYLLIIILYLVSLYFVLSNINKMKLKILYKNIEVDMNNKDEIFDHNINYLIDILKTVNIKYIVFEDIDRYQDIEIFEKIRNMNTLINLSLKSTIKFIYVISDDLIHKGLDRVKFFDYIYPIIPFVSYNTSGDKALARLKELGLVGENGLDRKFIYNTFLYINDYRIVTDIINEYIVYLNAIDDNIKKSNYFNYDSLFAIISYKVLLPDDFSKLEKESEECLLLSILACKNVEEIKAKAKEKLENDRIKDLSEVLKLLCFYISSGYISKQTYKTYIKRYYFNEIDINDFNFIQQANMLNIDEKDIDFKLKIDHHDIVIERLDESSYNNLSSLNYNLLSELLNQKTSSYKGLLKKYINTIFKLENKYKFLYDFYVLFSKKFDSLLNLIVEENIDIINGLIELDECNYKNDFIFLLLNKYELFELKINDTNYEKLITIITNGTIGIKNEVSNIFISNISELSIKGLKYKDLKGIKSDELLQNIVEKDSYEINKDNIDLILKKYYGYSSNKITNYPIKLLLDENNPYILSNKNKLISIYCENVSNLYTNDQDTIKTILSASEISAISKENFINSEKTKIDDISFINDVEILDIIIKERRFICSWNNIYYYYSKSRSKEILSNYITSDDGKKLCDEEIPDDIKKDISFLKQIILINDISNNLFNYLFNTYSDKYDLLKMFSTSAIVLDEYKLDKLLNINNNYYKEEVQRFKINIINNNFDIINESNVSKKLSKIEFDYSWMLINNKKPELFNNIETKNLIENLNNKLGYNIDYYENGKKILIRGSRNKKKELVLN